MASRGKTGGHLLCHYAKIVWLEGAMGLLVCVLIGWYRTVFSQIKYCEWLLTLVASAACQLPSAVPTASPAFDFWPSGFLARHPMPRNSLLGTLDDPTSSFDSFRRHLKTSFIRLLAYTAHCDYALYKFMTEADAGITVLGCVVSWPSAYRAVCRSWSCWVAPDSCASSRPRPPSACWNYLAPVTSAHTHTHTHTHQHTHSDIFQRQRILVAKIILVLVLVIVSIHINHFYFI